MNEDEEQGAHTLYQPRGETITARMRTTMSPA